MSIEKRQVSTDTGRLRRENINNSIDLSFERYKMYQSYLESYIS